MALIKCSECAKYVSDKNPICTRCKTPIAKSVGTRKEHEASRWESAGLFMASTGAVALFLFKPPIGITMVLSGLVVYAAGRYLIGKYL